jgi:REP element-mobilizing transposase RayT
MVAAYHLIWTIYGVWLPNDPRGSGSTEIRSRFLEELGEIHFGRKKIQPASSVIRKFYREAKPKLKHEIRPNTDDEIKLVAEAFAVTIQTRGYTCYGCAIMPDHVHILIRKHRDKAEEMIGYLQDESWKQLTETGNWPSGHPIWGGPGWKVFLNSCADIERTIRYIRENPIKAKRPEQIFEFVKAYDGWLPGIGATEK